MKRKLLLITFFYLFVSCSDETVKNSDMLQVQDDSTKLSNDTSDTVKGVNENPKGNENDVDDKVGGDSEQSGDTTTTDDNSNEEEKVVSESWSKIYGGTQGEHISALIELTNGDIVVTGYSWSTDGDFAECKEFSGERFASNAFIFRYDANGEEIWKKFYGGDESDKIGDIKATEDGGFIVVGESSSPYSEFTEKFIKNDDLWIMKLDGSGELQWTKTYGGTHYEYARKVSVTDYGYIIMARTLSHDGDIDGYYGELGSPWILKLDKKGELISQTVVLVPQDELRNNQDYIVVDGECVHSGVLYNSVYFCIFVNTALC